MSAQVIRAGEEDVLVGPQDVLVSLSKLIEHLVNIHFTVFWGILCLTVLILNELILLVRFSDNLSREIGWESGLHWSLLALFIFIFFTDSPKTTQGLAVSFHNLGSHQLSLLFLILRFYFLRICTLYLLTSVL